MKTNLDRVRVDRFRWTFAYLLVVSLSFTVTRVVAQENESQALSEPTVLKMLDRHTPQATIERLVLQRHIDFRVTEEVEKDLKTNHRASDELIAALKRSQPRSQEPISPNPEEKATEPPPNPVGVPTRSDSSTTQRGGSSVDSRTTASSNKTSTILIRADLACIVAVDGKEIGELQAGEITTRSVGIGQHIVEAKVPGLSLNWQKTVDVNRAGQVIVETEIQRLLDAKIAGNWHWDANHVTSDGCVFETDAWVLYNLKNTGSLSEKHVVLARNSSSQDEDKAPSTCRSKLSVHCIRSFRLELSLSSPASGLHFSSFPDPYTNLVISQFSEGDESAKRFCEQQRSLPTAGFTGTLTPISNSILKLKIDSLNVELDLTR